MSHANVTVTRTVTSSSANAIIINTGYLTTPSGILKILQLILGGVAIGLLADDYYNPYNYHISTPLLVALLAATTFFILTFCLLLSCIFSLSTGGLISKTLYEFVYHLIAAILLFIASIWLYLRVKDYKHFHNKYFTASVLCFINSILYLLSAMLAFREYRN